MFFTQVPQQKGVKQVWAKGRPKREATSRDWTRRASFQPLERAIRLIMRPIAWIGTRNLFRQIAKSSSQSGINSAFRKM
jgi:hypothetical protein